MTRRMLNGIRFCKCCGARMLLQGFDTKHRLSHIMQKKMICYECAYWQDIIDYPPEHLEIIGNKCLKICPVGNKKDKTIILGGKGKMRYFVRADLSIFQSNDIWLIGVIPARFIDNLKPTAKEITKKVFNRLTKKNQKCKARGCYDRYHCLRYNLELEADGAFNVVPSNWKIGGERCKFFINIDDAYIDDSSVNNKPNT